MSCSGLAVSVFNDQTLDDCLQLLISDVSLSTHTMRVHLIPITATYTK